MITVNYCCFDASAFSLGFASAHNGTLLLEKSENALSDYINAVIPSRINELRTDEGMNFAADFAVSSPYGDIIRNFNSVCFQYLSFALYSLNEICKKHSEVKASVAESVKKFISNKKMIFRRIVLNPNRQNYVSQAEAIFDFAGKISDNVI